MDFKRPPKELIEELKKYDTSGFSDAFDEIGFSNELGNELVCRPLVDFFGRAELFNLSMIHEGDPV